MESFVAIGFVPNRKYQDSVKLLRNYVFRIFSQVKGFKTKKTANNSASLFDLIKNNLKPKSSDDFKNYSSRPYTSIIKTQRLAPSTGLAASKKYCIYVEDNNLESQIALNAINAAKKGKKIKQKVETDTYEDDQLFNHDEAKNDDEVFNHYKKMMYAGEQKEEICKLYRETPEKTLRLSRITDIKSKRTPEIEKEEVLLQSKETLFQRMFPQLPKLGIKNIDIKKKSNGFLTPGDHYADYKRREKEQKRKEKEALIVESKVEVVEVGYAPLSAYSFRDIDPSKWYGLKPFR